MTPEFRHNESHVTDSERAYEAFLAKVRAKVGDFDYGTELESVAFDLFDADYSAAEAVTEIRHLGLA